MATSPGTKKRGVDEADQAGSAKDKAKDDKPQRRSDGTRETVESVVVAFILAFLVRTFEAEAFVIPTGSMAPTLYGRHIDFTCEKCGMESAVGASSELDRDTEYYVPSQRITSALCPNCRYDNLIYDARTKPRGLPGFKGDRILVNKFPYEFWEPERWDVVVFKYPEDPKTNYIKRLVGLPGEEIKIEWGDVYVRQQFSEPWVIARKDDPNKQRRLQLLVYDNDHPAHDLHEWGWPERWAPLEAVPGEEGRWSDDPAGWQPDYAARTFQIDAAGGDELRWIRYRHFLPRATDWEALEAGRPLEEQPAALLISDYCPYNAYSQRRGDESGRDDALWVGDLTINFNVEIDKPQGELLVELVRGAYRYRCRFDLGTGEATLYYLDTVMKGGEPPFEEHLLATAPTRLKRSGRHRVSFANVDQRLCLWVDDSLVDFGEKAEYGRPALPAPQTADLAPVGIAARGASVKVSRLLLQRDIYYRSDKPTELGTQNEYGDVTVSEDSKVRNYLRLRDLLDDPQAWYAEYRANRKVAEFEPLGPDEYFMMGDNSPHSQDSRLWPNTWRGAERRHAVPRTALVGKAFFVYWPHGVPFLNGGRGYGIPIEPIKQFSYLKVGPRKYPEDLERPEAPYPQFTVPFYPNVFRMHRIR